MERTIIDQMNKFFINSINFELEAKKLGRTRNRTAIRKIAGII